jgi:hypothetical protein
MFLFSMSIITYTIYFFNNKKLLCFIFLEISKLVPLFTGWVARAFLGQKPLQGGLLIASLTYPIGVTDLSHPVP